MAAERWPEREAAGEADRWRRGILAAAAVVFWSGVFGSDFGF